MGAGNPLLRSYDEDRYSPITYFFDFSIDDFEEWKKDFNEANEREDDPISDDEAYRHIGEEEFESFLAMISNFCFEKDSPFGYRYSHKNATTIDELTAGYRESAVVLAESEYTLIITSTDGENNHMPVAFVPNFQYADIKADIYYNNQHKEEWYKQRNKSFEDMISTLADKHYDRLCSIVKNEEKMFWKWFVESYPNFDFLSERNGPWFSHHITKEQLLYRFNINSKELV